MRKGIIMALCLLMSLALLEAEPQVELKRASFKFGKVKEGEKVKGELTLSNTGSSPLNINIVSSCSCLLAGDNKFSLAPGEKRSSAFTFDTLHYQGPIVKVIVIESNDPENPKLFFEVKGEVIGKDKKSPKPEKRIIDINESTYLNLDRMNNGAILYYFSYESCRECKPLLKVLTRWAEQQERNISIEFFRLEEEENKENLLKVTEKYQNGDLKLPMVIYKERYYGGQEMIEREFKAEDSGEVALGDDENDGVPPSARGEKEGALSTLSSSAIFFAGLADGVNPCAFTLIILLISYLSLQLKDKRMLLMAGLIYIGAVFITYFLLGLGLFEFLRRLEGYRTASLIFKYLLTGFLLVMAGLSLYDFIQYRRGRSDEMLLKLPGFLQSAARRTIRGQMKSYHIVGSSLLLGVTVSIFELGCTGQVYLPILGYIVRTKPGALMELGLLLLYNLAFIIPLAAVFVMVYRGFSSKKIGEFFSRKLSLVKVTFCVMFVGLAILNLRL